MHFISFKWIRLVIVAQSIIKSVHREDAHRSLTSWGIKTESTKTRAVLSTT